MSTFRINNPKKGNSYAWSYLDLTVSAQLDTNSWPIGWKEFTGATRERLLVQSGYAGLITFRLSIVRADMVLHGTDMAEHASSPLTIDVAQFDYVHTTNGEIVIDNPRPGARSVPVPVGLSVFTFHRDTKEGRPATAEVRFVIDLKAKGMMKTGKGEVRQLGSLASVSDDGLQVITPGFSLDLLPLKTDPDPIVPSQLLDTKVWFTPEGSATAKANGVTALSQWKNKLRTASPGLWKALDQGEIPVHLYGYATNTDTEAKNIQLSAQRNKAVKAELLKIGFNEVEEEALGIVRVDLKTGKQRTVPKGALDQERYVHVFIPEEQAAQALKKR